MAKRLCVDHFCKGVCQNKNCSYSHVIDFRDGTAQIRFEALKHDARMCSLGRCNTKPEIRLCIWHFTTRGGCVDNSCVYAHAFDPNLLNSDTLFSRLQQDCSKIKRSGQGSSSVIIPFHGQGCY